MKPENAAALDVGGGPRIALALLVAVAVAVLGVFAVGVDEPTAAQQLLLKTFVGLALAGVAALAAGEFRLRSSASRILLAVGLPVALFASAYAMPIEWLHASTTDAEHSGQPSAHEALVHGQEALKNGQYGPATTHFRSALESLDERNLEARAQAFIGLGDAWLGLTDYAAAQRAYSQALGLGTRRLRAVASEKLGHVEIINGHLDAARGHLQQAQRLYRAIGDAVGEANVQLRTGELLALRKDYDEALAQLNNARTQYRELGEKLGEAHASRAIGEVEGLRGEVDAARRRLDQAERLYEEQGDPLGQAAVARSRASLDKQAGQLQRATQDYKRAQKIYAQAKVEPGAVVVQAQLDAIYARQTQPPPDAQPAPDAQPGSEAQPSLRERAQKLWQEGYELFGAGRFPEAQELYEKAIEADPSFAPPYNSLGRLWHEGRLGEKDLDRAEDLVRKALKRRPDYTAAISNLGSIYRERGDREAAIATFLRVLKLKPHHALALKHLAEIHFELGDLTSAEHYARNAARADPRSKAVRELLSRIEIAHRTPKQTRSGPPKDAPEYLW